MTQTRCSWALTPGPMQDYHDSEWGVPPSEGDHETAYFERLTLEAFQSGLSWSTILAKRDNFRAAFAGFDPEAVAEFGPDDEARLMADAGIVRNRLKIAAAITNARATVALREAGGLEAFVLDHAPPEPPAHTATTSAASIELSRALKRRGFVFVGPTTMHAAMQALGVFDPHAPECFCHRSRPALGAVETRLRGSRDPR